MVTQLRADQPIMETNHCNRLEAIEMENVASDLSNFSASAPGYSA